MEERLRDECLPQSIGTAELSDEARSHFGPVCSYFNTIGVLVSNGVIDPLLTGSFMVVQYLGANPFGEFDNRSR